MVIKNSKLKYKEKQHRYDEVVYIVKCIKSPKFKSQHPNLAVELVSMSLLTMRFP